MLAYRFQMNDDGDDADYGFKDYKAIVAHVYIISNQLFIIIYSEYYLECHGRRASVCSH